MHVYTLALLIQYMYWISINRAMEIQSLFGQQTRKMTLKDNAVHPIHVIQVQDTANREVQHEADINTHNTQTSEGK